MENSIENIEISRFYKSLLQEIKSIQISDEEGGSCEQFFTQYAVDLLSDAGETENVRVAYDEKALGTKKQHKINAYSIADNSETIDLFITIYKGANNPLRISKDEIDTASKRIANFFRKAVYKDYVNEIEESSPIFDFAHTLGYSKELKENLVRVNVIILTDGFYPGEILENQNISGYPIYYRVVDLTYLYNITEKSHIPIEIDFKSEGFDVPCIASPSGNEFYQSYLAIIPGLALAGIYERFGSRLLEQNVRSFLQFAGKINKGIRTTILKEPHMFLAYNNGIAATAEEIEIGVSSEGNSLAIHKVKDFQIVNGGQTTASIYHTLKKDKADIENIRVQLKLNVVKQKDNISGIVSKISEYANTQNKVSVSDLSSNRPYHIELEKLSRAIVTPHITGKVSQTKWFYERARGQYKNARAKEGFTKSRQKAFDIKYPKSQMFTKEDLAKYINTYQEIYDGKKLVVGPNFVVRGNQKNYVQFINYNLVKIVDSIYFEDTVSKAILFRAAEKIYGVKPNSIGDLRYITVPYTISYLGFKTNYKLDLNKIWKNQGISEELKDTLYELMVEVEVFIKKTAEEKHGALYGEFAKKEDCWAELKNSGVDIDLSKIKNDLIDPKKPVSKTRVDDVGTEELLLKEELEKIKDIPAPYWFKIEDWGRITEKLTIQQGDVAFNMGAKLKNGSIKISEYERKAALRIIDIVIENNPELLFEIDEHVAAINKADEHIPPVTLNNLLKLDLWQKKNKLLDRKTELFYKPFIINSWEPKGGQIRVVQDIFKRAIEKGFEV